MRVLAATSFVFILTVILPLHAQTRHEFVIKVHSRVFSSFPERAGGPNAAPRRLNPTGCFVDQQQSARL